MAGITTTNILPAPVQQTFNYKLLSVEVPSMIHNIAAMKKEMPRNGGTTLRMRRYNPLQTAMVPLGVSGVTPLKVRAFKIFSDRLESRSSYTANR